MFGSPPLPPFRLILVCLYFMTSSTSRHNHYTLMYIIYIYSILCGAYNYVPASTWAQCHSHTTTSASISIMRATNSCRRHHCVCRLVQRHICTNHHRMQMRHRRHAQQLFENTFRYRSQQSCMASFVAGLGGSHSATNQPL